MSEGQPTWQNEPGIENSMTRPHAILAAPPAPVNGVFAFVAFVFLDGVAEYSCLPKGPSSTPSLPGLVAGFHRGIAPCRGTSRTDFRSSRNAVLMTTTPDGDV